MKKTRLGLPARALKICLLALLLPWAAVFTFRNVGFVEFPGGSQGAYIAIFSYLLLAMVGMFLGTIMSKHTQIASEYRMQSESIKPISNLARILAALSLIYLVAIIVDKVVLGSVAEVGLSLARDIANAEAETYGSRNSKLGAIYFLLSGTPICLGCLVVSNSQRFLSKRILSIFKVLVLLSFLSYFLSGGRNAFFITIIVLFGFLYLEKISNLNNKPNNNIHHKASFLTKSILVLLVFLGLGFSLYLFIDRAELRGSDMPGYISYLENVTYVRVLVLFNGGGLYNDIIGVLVMLVYYFTHPIEYLSEYFTQNFSPMFCGAYSFSIFTQIIDALTGSRIVDATGRALLAQGVYLSLPGSMYLDFGFFGVSLSSLILGFLTVFLVCNSIRSGRVEVQILASVALAVLVFSPIYFIGNSSVGMPVIIASLVIYLSRKRRLRVKDKR